MEQRLQPILDRIEKQIYVMCGLPNTILEENMKIKDIKKNGTIILNVNINANG